MKKNKKKTTTIKRVKKSKPRSPSAIKKPIGHIDMFRRQLDVLRENLLKIVKKKREEAIPEPEVGDEADVAVRSVARDLVFELSDNERHILDEVEAALRRIEKGTFGYCEANSERISLARLKAMPYARYCINCQSRFEHS